MARRRLSKTRPLRPLGPRGVIALLVALALWLAGRAPWSSADSKTEAPKVLVPTAATTPAGSDPAPSPSREAPSETRARIPTVALDPGSVWSSPQACEARIASVVAQPRDEALRIASWNLRWFPYGAKNQPRKAGSTDVAWMACVMASLRADVIAVQEVMTNQPGRAALIRLMDRLDALTHGQWRSYLDECPGKRRQHVGFLYDSARVQVDQLREVPEINPHGSACAGGLRPGAAARLSWSGKEWELLTVHLDSGDEARDYGHRLQSVRALMEHLPAREHPSVLALGDFNTMGCERCAPPVPVADELHAVNQALRTAGYRQVSTTTDAASLCSHHYEGSAQLLDRAITTLPAARVHMEPAGWCAELACQRPRTTSLALARLSDHCPIVVTVTP